MLESPGFPFKYRRKLLAYLLHLMGDPREATEALRDSSAAGLDLPSRREDVLVILCGIARQRGKLRARANEVLRKWTEWAWEADEGAEEDWLRRMRALRHCRERLQPLAARLMSFRYDLGLEAKAIPEKLGQDLGSTKVMLLRVRRALARCIRGRMREESTA